jgi:pimeloyl-ACP methyl ester carboxylesterase
MFSSKRRFDPTVISHCCRILFSSIVLGVTLLQNFAPSEALVLCALETGGGICPDNNTCCLVDLGGRNTSGCIPNDMGENAVCCGDGKTGCPMNYTCEQEQQCQAIAPWQDPLVPIGPRYRLCTAPQLRQVYGFPVDLTSIPESVRPQVELKFLYYSSHGSVLDGSRRFKSAVIGIHGSKRNADDYFCTLMAASKADDHHPDETLILAPRFPVATDSGLTNITNGGTALVWPDTDPDGPWRYGADDLNYGIVSSFGAVDDFVSYLLNHQVAEHVTLVGHSSGGQFVQRWALVSSVESSRIAYVVANPSSYAYLSPLRWLDGYFRLPDQAIYQCPDYNSWDLTLPIVSTMCDA